MSATTKILVRLNGVDGSDPSGGLTADANGDLFGTAVYGGPGGTPGYASGNGTVFEIPYNSVTGYSSTPIVLADFDGADGSAPLGSLLADANGDLFGTTHYGGANGSGVVFEITYSPQTGYATTPTVLASFTRGALPQSNLIEDASGDLFGTTGQDGAYGGGTVFEITKTTAGYSSTPTILTSFNALSGGEFPLGGLIADAAGDLFGTTDEGGANGYGTAFEIAKTASGYASTPTVLVNFDASTEGQFGSLVADANGDLFGTSTDGGAYLGGAVYEIAKTATGYGDTATVLASFNGPVSYSSPVLNTDGSDPAGTLIIDFAGNLFGTTKGGGATNDGTVFEVAKTATGYDATPTDLYSFSDSNGDGALPASGLIADANGDLLGTTEEGGTSNGGTIFEITDTGFIQPGTGPEEFFENQAAASGPLSGDFLWSNAANWTDGVPFENDSAISLTQGIDDVAALTLGELSLTAGGTVTAVQNLTIDILVADASSTLFASTTLPGGLASVTVSIGAFQAAAGTYGADGSGAVLADNAATSPGGALFTASDDGKIAVADDLTIGGAAAGALEVATGGQVTSVNGNIVLGSATVDGSGSSWTMSGALTIGVEGGSAAPSLTISDDASATTNLSTEDYVLAGSLTLETGGQLTEDALSVHSAGTLTVESNAVLSEVASSPSPTVSGLYGNGRIFFNGGTLASDNEYTVIGGKTTYGGTEAGNGMLTASNGATGTSLATYLGYDSGDVGTLVLSGSNTLWGDDFADALDNNDAGINVGVNGSGSLTVEDGAYLSNPQSYIKIAQFKGSIGSAVVTGSGSAMSAGGLLRVGDSGAGTLTIADGGVVVAGQVQVSDYGGSIGMLDIDTGSRLATNGFSTVDTGSQKIAGEGTIQVAAGSFDVAVQGGSKGYVDINGGTLTVQGDMMIGDVGSGTMSVENGGTVNVQGVLTVAESGFAVFEILGGGTVSAASMVIGDHPDLYDSGNVDVSGGILTVQGSLAFGTTGSGTLSIENGGIVTVGAFDIGDRGGVGALQLRTGGTLIAGSVLVGPLANIQMLGGVLDPPTQITIDANGNVLGYGTIDGAVDNGGSITASGGTLEISGDISGAGLLTFASAASLQLDGAVTDTAGIAFTGGSQSLILGTHADIETTISGLGAGDTVALLSQSVASAVYSAASGQLAISGSDGGVFDLTLSGAHQQSNFAVADGEVTVACFLRGTRLATADGEVCVERLAVGDAMRTQFSGLGAIKWIGHRHIDCRRHADPRRVRPVRIRAGAFGDAQPFRDLWLSPDHAVLVDDVLIPVQYLVDGRSIVQEAHDEVTYYHVELQRHDAVFAEGLACESYLDTGNRANFASAGAAVALHPDFSALTWDAQGCAPLLVTGAAVEAVRRHLQARAHGRRREGASGGPGFRRHRLPQHPALPLRDPRIVGRGVGAVAGQHVQHA